MLLVFSFFKIEEDCAAITDGIVIVNGCAAVVKISDQPAKVKSTCVKH